MPVALTPPSKTGLMLEKPKGIFQRLDSLGENVQTFERVATGKSSDDDHLGPLDKNMRATGAIGIAALGSQMRTGRWLALPEWLGMGTWLGAMALTPFVINKLLVLKTGVDLGSQYQNPEGRRQFFYKDASYMPLHLLTEADIQRIAKKLGIPADTPHFRDVTEDKIRQLARQGQTVWMLTAGPATPILTAGIASQLHAPLQRAWVNAQQQLTERRLERLSRSDSAKTQTVFQQWLGHLTGLEQPSQFGLWFSRFNRQLPGQWGLTSSRQPGADSIAQQLKQLSPEQLKLTHQWLSKEKDNVVTWQKSLQRWCAAVEKAQPLDPSTRTLVETAQDRLTFGLQTIHRQMGLLDAAGYLEPEALSQWLYGVRVTPLEALAKQGNFPALQAFLGPDAAPFITALHTGLTHKIEALLGAPPLALLEGSLKTMASQQTWRRSYLWGLGGLTAAATLLAITTLVGHKATKEELSWSDGPN